MERYQDCRRYMSDLQGTVDNIKKAVDRTEIEDLEKHAKDLVQRIMLKAVYMIGEVHDLSVRRQTELMEQQARLMVERQNGKG